MYIFKFNICVIDKLFHFFINKKIFIYCTTSCLSRKGTIENLSARNADFIILGMGCGKKVYRSARRADFWFQIDVFSYKCHSCLANFKNRLGDG